MPLQGHFLFHVCKCVSQKFVFLHFLVVRMPIDCKFAPKDADLLL